MELCSAFHATAKRQTQCWSTGGSLWLNEGVWAVSSETCSPGDLHQVLGVRRMVLRETPSSRRSRACDSAGAPTALKP